ncbi:MAG: LysR family transcriptional regulator [Burkholderiales bacterium]|nr:LysR family transcriptional regulator [Burkholderiales bacterium]
MVKRKRLPPLKALRAFEVSARLGSFARAAEELCVTQTAVSHQVKILEEFVGGLLFERVSNGLLLTPLGQTIRPGIEAGFAQFESALSLLPRPQLRSVETLVISALPSFTQEWLMPRLETFRSQWPDIDVMVQTEYKMVDLHESEVDVAIRFSRPGFDRDLKADLLATEQVFPVCSPAVLDQAPGSYRCTDLRRFTLLHSSVRMVHEPWMSWDLWLEEAGCQLADITSGPCFSDPLLILRAAVAGRGLVLGRSMLVRDHLLAGRLVAPFADWRKPIMSSYFVVSTAAKAKLPKVAALRAFLLDCAQRDARGEAALAEHGTAGAVPGGRQADTLPVTNA